MKGGREAQKYSFLSVLNHARPFWFFVDVGVWSFQVYFLKSIYSDTDYCPFTIL